jgi:hypothetical protein
MNNNLIQLNNSKIEKIIKYIIIGLIVICSLKYIPDTILKTNELIIIGLITSITYAIFDIISPSIRIYNNSKIDNKY